MLILLLLKEKKMAAPKGNNFWEARSSHGRKPIFASSEQLWDAACEYFKWNEENPLWEARLVSFQGASDIEKIPKLRAMTESAMCLFLDITEVTWRDYKKKEGFSSVAKKIEETIRNQKFQGASADLFNANIIARDLGLRDKKDIDHSSTDGTLTPTKIVLTAKKDDNS